MSDWPRVRNGGERVDRRQNDPHNLPGQNSSRLRIDSSGGGPPAAQFFASAEGPAKRRWAWYPFFLPKIGPQISYPSRNSPPVTTVDDGAVVPARCSATWVCDVPNGRPLCGTPPPVQSMLFLHKFPSSRLRALSSLQRCAGILLA
jgi:hypothetical protein